MIKFVIILTILSLGCQNDQDSVNKPKGIDIGSSTKVLNQDSIQNLYMSDFFKSKGIVAINHLSGDKYTRTTIFEANKSIYCEVDFDKFQLKIKEMELDLEDFEMIRDTLDIDFKPFSFYPDYFLLEFEYLGKVDSGLEVLINKEKKISKFIPINSNVSVLSWFEYFMGSAIGFNKLLNPIKSNPIETADVIKYDESIIWEIAEVKGDWIKIVCSNICDNACPENSTTEGWIKWKNKDVMIIDLLSQC